MKICKDNNLIMIGAHIAHDCIIGNNIVMANNAAIAGHATPHDITVISELAKVLTGGECDHTKELSEDDILALEREAISTLARNELSLARMEHMLSKGKPLRN